MAKRSKLVCFTINYRNLKDLTLRIATGSKPISLRSITPEVVTTKRENRKNQSSFSYVPKTKTPAVHNKSKLSNPRVIHKNNPIVTHYDNGSCLFILITLHRKTYKWQQKQSGFVLINGSKVFKPKFKTQQQQRYPVKFEKHEGKSALQHRIQCLWER